jgi:hypothetical protein
MNRHALAYPLAPGRDDEAAKAVLADPWPVGWSDGDTKLTACTVFHRGGLLLRILDIDGDINACLSGLARSSQVVSAESALATLLAAPEEVTSAPDIERLHARSAAPRFAGRFTDPALLPPGFGGITTRAALAYPVRPGYGAALEKVLSGGRNLPVRADATTALASTAVFRQYDLVVRLVEVAGDITAGFAHLRATASKAPTAGRLAELLQSGYDLRTADGFDNFLATCALTLVSDDRVYDARS